MDELAQAIHIRALQLGKPSPIQYEARQRMLGYQLLENAFLRRRNSLRSLRNDRKTQLVEQDFCKLLRRSDVELLTGKVENLFLENGNLIAQLSRSEEHTPELQSREKIVCRLLLAKKNT